MLKGIFGSSKKKPGKSSDSNSETQSNAADHGSIPGAIAEPQAQGQRDGSERAPSTYDFSSSRAASSLASSSVFSKGRHTSGTGASSSTGSTYGRKSVGALGSELDDVGKPLRVVNSEKFNYLNPVFEEEGPNEGSVPAGENTHATQGLQPSQARQRRADSLSRNTRSLELVKNELNILEDNLVGLMDDIHQNVTSISKAVIQAIEYFKQFLPTVNVKLSFNLTFERSSSLRAITKIFLHFMDNLLMSEAFGNSRSILMRRYIYFLEKLNISTPADFASESQLAPCLNNFCIDSTCTLPNRDNISRIIEEISKSDPSLVADQDGAFMAPVLRGLTRKSAILTVMFGVPNPQQEHQEIVKALYSVMPDVHFYCVKDYIQPCAEVLNTVAKPMSASTPLAAPPSTFQFSPPYRLAPDALKPPISMSLSSDQSSKTTGTLGGYLFPQIEKGSKLSQFAGASFAITCSHVVLSESQDYPYVSIPSKVLQTTYRKTLSEESHRYPEDSVEHKAFQEEIRRVDENMKWQEQNKFGQVVWGERSIVNQKLSDFAIIKVGQQYKCENCLGIGLTGVPDPTLRFQNMYVKEKILKLRPGLQVFKIGAATNYTSGSVNAAKLVYWADGKLQSSEFVVSSPMPLFASAGDSGSWILTKLENRLGLGVVGMLHSYDGEQRQFGLFTPIGDILERLHTVTGVLWDIDAAPT
ncbi:hypothetical protein HG536_0B03580 [Torulaspora globosa]|uniref:SPS-sensor serine protease component SSY5 n=1 Tax=Torulaspora globosa TaxID=48254 RepID=A0A7G3ZDA9_9SACH|nr:uncharacterized protein HG536_0B03580 [Torulaspora globosa]QLL31495.1 hypothetical protein HG536_0B03580 [Torulaspora globosa]